MYGVLFFVNLVEYFSFAFVDVGPGLWPNHVKILGVIVVLLVSFILHFLSITLSHRSWVETLFISEQSDIRADGVRSEFKCSK